MDTTITKPDKNSLKYLGIIIIIAIIVCLGFFYYLKKTELKEVSEEKPTGRTMKEILESLSASEPGEPISEELLESLSASDSFEPSEDTEDILKSLTAPE